MDWGEIKHFAPEEFGDGIDEMLVRQLDNAREYAQVPFILTSTVRPDAKKPEHRTGHAADIRCHDSRSRFRILYGLVMAGFDRIGIYDRHVHAGVSPDLDPEVVWLGESK